jgi:hypothetical protein
MLWAESEVMELKIANNMFSKDLGHFWSWISGYLGPWYYYIGSRVQRAP